MLEPASTDTEVESQIDALVSAYSIVGKPLPLRHLIPFTVLWLATRVRLLALPFDRTPQTVPTAGGRGAMGKGRVSRAATGGQEDRMPTSTAPVSRYVTPDIRLDFIGVVIVPRISVYTMFPTKAPPGLFVCELIRIFVLDAAINLADKGTMK